MSPHTHPIDHLRAIEPYLQAVLGGYWSIRVFTRMECEKNGRVFDPPCAYLEARCSLGAVQVCEDGEVYVHEQQPYKVDLQGNPVQVAIQIVRGLHVAEQS